VLKQHINSYRDTDLKQTLDGLKGVKKLVIAGAMSHMCIDGATRASVDFGYDTTVIHDACATLELDFGGNKVPAKQVHNAYMAALQFGYCKVVDHEEVLRQLA